MEKFGASGLKTFDIPLNSSERVRIGEGSRRSRRTARNMGWGVGRVQKEKIRSGQKEGRVCVSKGGAEALHWLRGAR